VADYAQLAEITYLAFFREPFVDEMPLVDFLRHSPNFDPELSLIAEKNNQIIGHALFTPYTLLLNKKPVRAALLGPLTVRPDFQRQGLGGQLLNYAHERLQERGFQMAFLWGHPAYYPRFGYLPRMFGKCLVRLSRQDVQIVNAEISERSVQPSDLAELEAMWHVWFAEVDLAILPGKSLADWISHSVNIRTSTLLINGKIRGFVRYHKANPEKPRLFVTSDSNATTILLGWLKQKITNPTVTELELPVHPAARATCEWIAYPVIPEIEPWDACMIKIFDNHSRPVTDYCTAVSRGLRQPGLPILPPNFEIV
jgi:predicted N-acetyltransferase YhbS